MLILKLPVRTKPCFSGEKAETQFQSEWMYASFVDHIISSALNELQDDETNKSNITITGAFPTEQAIRHKVQKKKFKEQYFDGCGSDTVLIGYSRMRSSVPSSVPFVSMKRVAHGFCYYDWDIGQFSDLDPEDDYGYCF